MKSIVTFVLFGIVAVSLAVPKYDNCDENVKNSFDKESCIEVQCESFKNETLQFSKLRAHSCPIAYCKEGEKYKGETPVDESKVYPDCCSKPICEKVVAEKPVEKPVEKPAEKPVEKPAEKKQ